MSKHITGLEATRLANEKRTQLSLLRSPYREKRLDESSSSSAVKQAPPRLRQAGKRGAVALAPQTELQAHKAAFRETDEFVDEMLTQLHSALAPGPWGALEPGTLNAAIAIIASIKPQSELEALLAVQIVATGFAGLKFLQRSQRHLDEAHIGVYGGYGTRLLRLQLETGQPAAWSQADGRGATCAYPFRRPGGGRHHRFEEGRRRRGRGRKMTHAPGQRARTTAPSGSLWCQDPIGSALPVTCCDRQKALPHAWLRRRIRRTQGVAERQLQAWSVYP